MEIMTYYATHKEVSVSVGRKLLIKTTLDRDPERCNHFGDNVVSVRTEDVDYHSLSEVSTDELHLTAFTCATGQTATKKT